MFRLRYLLCPLPACVRFSAAPPLPAIHVLARRCWEGCAVLPPFFACSSPRGTAQGSTGRRRQAASTHRHPRGEPRKLGGLRLATAHNQQQRSVCRDATPSALGIARKHRRGLRTRPFALQHVRVGRARASICPLPRFSLAPARPRLGPTAPRDSLASLRCSQRPATLQLGSRCQIPPASPRCSVRPQDTTGATAFLLVLLPALAPLPCRTRHASR